MDADAWGQVVEGLITTAFVVVFLFVMGLVIYRLWIRHVLQHHRARSELPRLASELGLRHNVPKDPKKLGSLSGTYRGYRVSVDADAHESSAKLRVHLETRPQLVLTRQRWGKSSGMETVSFPQGRLNRYFKTRQAPPKLAKWIAEARSTPRRAASGPPAGYRRAAPTLDEGPDVAAALDQFVAKWGRQLVVCELNHDELGCSPALGSGENTVQSVSAAQVRALLPDLLVLAETLAAMPTPADLDD
jgi:hypothetical protein